VLAVHIRMFLAGFTAAVAVAREPAVPSRD
jgi:hypothetical protein